MIKEGKTMFDKDNWKSPDMELDDEIDGRFIDRVNEYASTCDGCQEMSMHENMVMDKNTELGYCLKCVKEGKLPPNFVDSESEETGK